jgi:hypothetical protein
MSASGWLPLLAVLVVAIVVAVKGVRRVPTGQVGVVYRRYGPRRRDDDFKVSICGAVGPQAATLDADGTYWLMPVIYDVRYVPQTHVPPGTIGVVVARVGSPPAATRTLCEPVDCNCFQDGRAFLAGGGQMGRQPAILPGGAFYDVNPEIFEVVTVENIGAGRHDLTAADLTEVAVPGGSVGVVIVLEGAVPEEDDQAVRPKVPGHDSFQNVRAFLCNGGQRGTQSETLCTGLYRINPWFARIALIPTRVLFLEWTKRETKAASNYDSALDRVRINVEGHWLRFDMSQTIRISPEAAPGLVVRFGEQDVDKFGFSEAANPTPVQRFVERVLGQTVAAYFQATASQYTILDFIEAHDEVCIALAVQIGQALAAWGVEAVDTTLGEFELETTALDDRRVRYAEERDRKQELEYQLVNTRIQGEIDRDRIEVERLRRQLEVAKLAAEIKELGREPVAMKLFLAELKHMKVPEFVGSDAALLLQHLPFTAAQAIIGKAMRWNEQPASAPGAGTGTATRELEFVPIVPEQQRRPLPAGRGNGSARAKQRDAVHDWTDSGTAGGTRNGAEDGPPTPSGMS